MSDAELVCLAMAQVLLGHGRRITGAASPAGIPGLICKTTLYLATLCPCGPMGCGGVAQRLLAVAACIWHDWRIGTPEVRSLIAYDH